jgi:hypothetical protein
MVSLLSQSGRLPLITPQRTAGWAIAKACKLALQWQKADGEGYGELKASDIPERFKLEAGLEISLPQDQLQLANVAKMLKGTVSDRWIRENILKIGQSDAMQKEIWTEQTQEALVMQFIQQMLAAQQQQQAAPMPGPGGPAGPGLSSPMQPPMPQPPGPMAGMQPQLQGLPPEMAQGGGQPPDGTLPPEGGQPWG